MSLLSFHDYWRPKHLLAYVPDTNYKILCTKLFIQKFSLWSPSSLLLNGKSKSFQRTQICNFIRQWPWLTYINIHINPWRHPVCCFILHALVNVFWRDYEWRYSLIRTGPRPPGCFGSWQQISINRTKQQSRSIKFWCNSDPASGRTGVKVPLERHIQHKTFLFLWMCPASPSSAICISARARFRFWWSTQIHCTEPHNTAAANFPPPFFPVKTI